MAKINTFIKPSINLPLFPAINMYIHFEYSMVETLPDYVNFVNHCLTVAETSQNEAKAQAYFNMASSLYAFETNVSYESKLVELLAEKL